MVDLFLFLSLLLLLLLLLLSSSSSSLFSFYLFILSSSLSTTVVAFLRNVYNNYFFYTIDKQNSTLAGQIEASGSDNQAHSTVSIKPVIPSFTNQSIKQLGAFLNTGPQLGSVRTVAVTLATATPVHKMTSSPFMAIGSV